MKSFFQHSEFISISLEADNFEMGVLSFLRLIGTAYFWNEVVNEDFEGSRKEFWAFCW